MLRRVIDLADTVTSETRGDADTVYRMQPRVWLQDIVDAAKKRFYAAQFAYTTELQKGQNSVVIPKRRVYIGSGTGTAAGFGGASEGAAVPYTTLSNLSGVALEPSDQNMGIALSNKNIRTGAVDYVRAAREELTYAAGDEVDRTVFNAINSDSNKATSGLLGSQSIYGGDKTSAAQLAGGDVITTDMVAAGKRKLQSAICKYWTYGTSEANCAEAKNPWQNSPATPFILLAAPEQEETFLTDSQFVNASEYGDDTIVKNGEIGKYLGVRIVVANNTPYYAAAATHGDGTSAGVAGHRCAMIVGNKAVGLAWGLKPKLYVFDYPSELEKRLVLEQSYAAGQIHSDAIVHINVADE